MEYAQRIRETMARATDADMRNGTDWYRTAHETSSRLANEYGTDAETVARTIAVLSPRKRWAENVSAAEAIIRAWSDGLESRPDVAGCFTANLDKAWRIVNGDHAALSGPKVTRFAANILGDDSEVTLDVWAMRAAGSDLIAPNGAKMYAEIAEAYRTVAAEYGIPASALQAVAWTVIRGGHE